MPRLLCLWANATLFHSCLTMGLLMAILVGGTAMAAEPPAGRFGGRPLLGDGGILRRVRDDLRNQLTPRPNLGVPATPQSGDAQSKAADQTRPAPRYRDPIPSANKGTAKTGQPPVSKTAVAKPAAAPAPMVTKTVPANPVVAAQATAPVATPAVPRRPIAEPIPVPEAQPRSSSAATSVSMAPLAGPINLKDASTSPYDQSVFSVLVSDKARPATEWKSLFNGKDLTGWESSHFGGDGEITVANGAIVLAEGGDMTGITYKGEMPKLNYELEVEARRVGGIDFFAGITFPVGENHMSMIPGGWAGGVFGLSSVNGMDAAENETTKARTFDDNKWYRFTIHVTAKNVRVAVDGKEEIDLDTTGKKLSTRGEVESSKPLGIATWRTKSEIRAIRIRPLSPQEIEAAR